MIYQQEGLLRDSGTRPATTEVERRAERRQAERRPGCRAPAGNVQSRPEKVRTCEQRIWKAVPSPGRNPRSDIDQYDPVSWGVGSRIYRGRGLAVVSYTGSILLAAVDLLDLYSAVRFMHESVGP